MPHIFIVVVVTWWIHFQNSLNCIHRMGTFACISIYLNNVDFKSVTQEESSDRAIK